MITISNARTCFCWWHFAVSCVCCVLPALRFHIFVSYCCTFFRNCCIFATAQVSRLEVETSNRRNDAVIRGGSNQSNPLPRRRQSHARHSGLCGCPLEGPSANFVAKEFLHLRFFVCQNWVTEFLLFVFHARNAAVHMSRDSFGK